MIVIPLAYCSDMPSNASSATGNAAELDQLAADLQLAEHHLARAVLAAGRLAGTGTCEKIEGLPLDLFIGLIGRLPGADRSTLIGAGQVLLRMPATARLFEQGAISWGQVRRITKAARTLRADERAELDACVAATAEEHSGLDAFGPDQLCDAVDAAADDLRDPRSIERREAAAAQANFLSVQHTLFNRVQIYADYDEVSAAPIIDMFDAAAGQPHGCGEPEPAPTDAEAAMNTASDAESDSHAASVPERFTRRGKQYADALADIAAHYLAGSLGASRARPLLNVFVDLNQISVNNAGTVQLNVRGPLPRISLAALELLSKDADCRAVIFDRKRPLCVSKKLYAKDIPADVAFAVAARDLGDRWPGSNDPLGHTENHHIKMRLRGGVHHVDDLVRLSRRHHRTHHDHQWQMQLDPRSGVLTIRRGKRVWRSLPRGTPLSRPKRRPNRGTHPPRGSNIPPAADPTLPF